MLTLSRKNGERLVLLLPDGQIATMEFWDIHGGRCKVAIEGPSNFRVWREEVYTKIVREAEEKAAREQENCPSQTTGD